MYDVKPFQVNIRLYAIIWNSCVIIAKRPTWFSNIMSHYVVSYFDLLQLDTEPSDEAIPAVFDVPLRWRQHRSGSCLHFHVQGYPPAAKYPSPFYKKCGQTGALGCAGILSPAQPVQICTAVSWRSKYYCGWVSAPPRVTKIAPLWIPHSLA